MGSSENFLLQSFFNLINSTVQSVNSCIQTDKNITSQRENLMFQFEHQREMQEMGYRQQIASQLRTYKLNNSWPLDTMPEQVADSISVMEGNLPLYLIIAPCGQSGFQKSLESMWTQIANFYITEFRLNSETPVILGKYKKDLPANPMHDYQIIWDGLKNIPTLFISPYSTGRDRILGIIMATWGSGERPTVTSLEIDLRKLQIDATRKETEKIVELVNAGQLSLADISNWQENIDIFRKEYELFSKNLDWQYLDQTLEFYKGLKVTSSVYTYMAEQISPLIKLLSSCMVDIYFVLGYGTAPKFPQIVNSISNMPELLIRKANDDSSNFTSVNGKELVHEIFTFYSSVIAIELPPLEAIKYIEMFNNAVPETSTFYEEQLFMKCFPDGLATTSLTDVQKRFLDSIANIPNIEHSAYFAKLINTSPKLLNNRTTTDLSTKDVYLSRFFAESDADSIIAFWEEAIQNNPDAIYQLAVFFSKSFEKSLGYFRKASQMQHLQSIFALWEVYGECFSSKEKQLIEAMKKIIHKCNVTKDFYHKGSIPNGKLQGAMGTYALHFDENEILALYDNTFLGGAEDGFVVSYRGIAMADEGRQKPTTLFWSDIKKICVYANELTVIDSDGHNVKIFVKDIFKEAFKDMLCDLMNCHTNYWENYGLYSTKDEIYNSFPRRY